MKKSDFCPVCGTEQGPFIKGFCRGCFLKKHSLVEFPEKAEFGQCKTCAKIRVFGRARPFSKRALEELVEKKVKVHDLEMPAVNVSLQEKDGQLEANVFVKGIIDSMPLTFEKTVPVVPVAEQCDACMRVSSQYHEAIVQLRGKGKSLERALPALINAVEEQHSKDSLAVVTEQKNAKGGFDLKVGSKRAAFSAMKKMQKMFHAEAKMSSRQLKGGKDGKTKLRYTFLVRV